MTLWAALYASPAIAQARPDQEYRRTELEGDEPLTVGVGFETEYYEYGELDMRALDESSDQAILDSDDRGAFAFTGASLDLAYAVDPQVRFVLGASHRGLWGDDQIGSVNEYAGFLYFSNLKVELSTAPTNGVEFHVGRQSYEIGGLGGAEDYALDDILDMVRIDLPLGDAGRIELVPINVFSVASDYGAADFVSQIGQQYPETYGFRGETLTRRTGLTLRLDGIPGPADLTAYAFYSDVGGRGTGADISYHGELGNFVDNDWVANFGLRAAATFGPMTPFAHLDLSQGIDRKELTALTVDCNGYAVGGGLRVDTDEGEDTEEAEEQGGLEAEVSGFYAPGPAYARNGLQYSHGYVGMKGNQVGGTLLDRFLGWHPSAYLGRDGVADTPNDTDRKAGSAFAHAEGSYELASGLSFSAGWWMVLDNGYTELNPNELDSITPPFGYSRSEFEAEFRVARLLAQEVDLEVGYEAGEHVEVYVAGAYVVPGAFYELEIDRVAGTALGSMDPQSPWSVFGGTRVSF
jgi:hypothetical protein